MADILMYYPCAHTQKPMNDTAFSFKTYLSFTGTSLGELS